MSPLRKVLVGGALAGSALLGGAVGASFLGTAGAQTTTDPSTTAPAVTTPANTGRHQANGSTEAPLTGDNLAKATAAAQAAVPGATVDRAESDADGATYEVHMTKSDGTKVTVKLDANFAATQTINGNG